MHVLVCVWSGIVNATSAVRSYWAVRLHQVKSANVVYKASQQIGMPAVSRQQ